MKQLAQWMIILSMAIMTNSQVGAVELLLNGNLEQGGGTPPDWMLSEFPTTGTGNFDTAELAGFADRTGDPGELGLFLKPWAGGSAPPGRLVNAVLTQTVNATAGEGYSFSGWSRWELNYAGGVTTLSPSSPFGAIPSPTRTELELAFLDASQSVIGSPVTLDVLADRVAQTGGLPNNDFWLQHEFDQIFGGGSPLIAPAGTAHIRVTASMLDGAFNTDPMQSAFFDDFSLIAASDPTTEILANAGLDMPAVEFPEFDVIELPMGINTVSPAGFAQNANSAGGNGAWLRPWANMGLVADPNDAIMSQTVPGIVGGDYTFSLWTRFEGNYAGGVDVLSAQSPNGAVASPTQTTMELAFLDAGQNVIGSPMTLDLEVEREAMCGGNANACPGNGWTQHTINATSPAGTAFVRVTGAMIDGVFNVDPQQSAFFDDFSLMLAGGIDGDFNDDGNYDCLDVDALVGDIAAGNNTPSFDLTGDGNVDLADRDAWLLEAGEANIGPGRAYKLGDANLDGVVDGSDFGLWNANKFTNLAEWCSGDFNADGVIDGSDFGAWNANKFTSSDSATVPEPSVLASLLLLWAVLSVRRARS